MTSGSRNFVGSKAGAGVWQAIVSAMPPHRTYIEAFLGTGIVARMKLPSVATIAIDADAAAPGFNLCQGTPCFTAIHGDAVQWLDQRAWTGTELVYADPPYLRSVRSCPRDYYAHEFATRAEHLRLLAVLKKIPVPVILSGYWSQLYADELPGWRTIQIPTVNRRGRPVTEWLWLNFPEPFALHDYRFLGRNFRERERIKRKKSRWTNRLLTMPALERAAVLAAIDDASCSWRSAPPKTAMVHHR